MGRPAAPAGTTVYVYGKGLVLSKSSDGTVLYYHQDALGSNRVVTGSDGEIQGKSAAYPYGEPVQAEGFGSRQARFTFTGKEQDSKLYYYGARYYNPRTMRFTGADPIAATGSYYAYANGNPLRFNDPTGMAGEDPKKIAQPVPSPVAPGNAGPRVEIGQITLAPADFSEADVLDNLRVVGQPFLAEVGDSLAAHGRFALVDSLPKDSLGVVTSRGYGGRLKAQVYSPGYTLELATEVASEELFHYCNAQAALPSSRMDSWFQNDPQMLLGLRGTVAQWADSVGAPLNAVSSAKDYKYYSETMAHAVHGAVLKAQGESPGWPKPYVNSNDWNAYLTSTYKNIRVPKAP